jgi:hypothetical protein
MSRIARTLSALLVAALAAACGPPKGVPVEEVLADLDAYRGRLVDVRAKLKSGARCRQGEDGEWKTYCKDCLYCRGPMVVDVGTTTSTSAEFDDWPMVLGGTYDLKDIRCKGPLNQVECFPFIEGKTYVIRGTIEFQRPPKLLVNKFWPVD